MDTADTTYNGYTNYETWAVKLWIDNEEGDYRLWTDRTVEVWAMAEDEKPDYMTASEYARVLISEELKEWAEASAPDLGASVWADLLNAALSGVDWLEIADNLLTDTDGYEAKE